jgi:hypothetical protein
MHYRVFLNETHLSRFMQLMHGAELRLAYAAQLETRCGESNISVLNRIYQMLNVAHPNNYINRSLSVADVVTVFERKLDCGYKQPHSYVVQGVGFSELESVILTDCVYAGPTVPAFGTEG